MFRGIIYKTTNNINGKIYVGQDRYNKATYLGSGKILWNAIRKYGLTNFSKEILEHCTSKEHMHEQEKFWIKELDACNRLVGYNIALGGNGGDTISKNPNKQLIVQNISKGLLTICDNNITVAKRTALIKLRTICDNGLSVTVNSAIQTAETMKIIQSDGLTLRQKATDKSVETKHIKLIDGLTIHQKAAIQTAETMKIIQSDGLTLRQKATDKQRKTVLSKILVKYPELAWKYKIIYNNICVFDTLENIRITLFHEHNVRRYRTYLVQLARDRIMHKRHILYNVEIEFITK